MRIGLMAIMIAIAFGVGWVGGQKAPSTSNTTDSPPQTEKKPLYWVAPMDDSYRRDKPGKSPMGMDLVPVYEEQNSNRDDGGIQISPTLRHNLGVEVAAVSRGPVSAPVHTVGYVTDNEDELLHVHSRIAGWVEVLNVRAVGETVNRGQPLYEIYSPELVNAQQEFLMSQRLNQGSQVSASGGKLRALGMTDTQIANLGKTGKVRERITVFSPGSGYVTALPVRAGMYVRPDTEIMAIGNLDSVWVIAEFFERQAGLISAGQKVDFTTPSLPGRQWQGTIDYVFPELDARTRTLRARVRVPNPDGSLRPNMFVNLNTQAPLGDDLLTIPRPALIQRSNSQHVLLAEGDGYFRPVPVSTGEEAGGRVVIRDGLEEGQQVVVSAQFLIDSETNLEAAMMRLDADGQSSGSNAVDSNPPAMITGVGRITDMDPEAPSITLDHDPIPELNWPAMTMAFALADSVNTGALAESQEVRFEFRETPEGYLIERIEPAQDAP